jgi:hypothetical protein
VARGELEVPIAGVFALDDVPERTNSSNCATPAASYCCDCERRGSAG